MPASRFGQFFTIALPRHTLRSAGIAFCAGLLLFVVVWLNERSQNEIVPPGPTPPQVETSQAAPLPEPLPAHVGDSDIPPAQPAPTGEETPRLADTAPPPQPMPETPAPPPAAPEPAANAAPAGQPTPLPDQSPPPAYPTAALRRGESGTVVVRVQVDAKGIPLDARIVQRSGSRDLDRAALDAVRRWRFQPAQNNGQPMAGSLDIPITFRPAQ